MPNPPIALTIAGFDPCGGAGLQADLKTFHAHGVYGLSVATAITVQNTQGVAGVYPLSTSIVQAQLENLLADFTIQAVKIGMPGSVENVRLVSHIIGKYKLPNVVLDPVIKSQSGFDLLGKEGQNALLKELFPLCLLVTPNIEEAGWLCSFPVNDRVSMIRAAEALHNRGAKNILIKSGHLTNNQCSDLFFNGKNQTFKDWPLIAGESPHGTGCTLAAAIAANLSLGQSIELAVANAQTYLQGLLKNPLKIGQGYPLLKHTHNTKLQSKRYKTKVGQTSRLSDDRVK